MKHAWTNHIAPRPRGQTAGSPPARYECQNCGLVTQPHDYRDHGPLRSWLDSHPPCVPPIDPEGVDPECRSGMSPTDPPGKCRRCGGPVVAYEKGRER